MQVAVVGLGIMGAAMASKLIEAGHAVTVSNRSRDKAAPLLGAGAAWADTPAQAAERADVVISMVTDPAAVRAVSLGDAGILAGLGERGVHAEMSTISPGAAGETARAYAGAGKRYVQAPVLGSRPQIEQTTLLVAAGGAPADIDACRPVWQAFAKRVWTLDTPEQAAALKLAGNMLMGQMILGLGQSLAFASRFGVAPAEMLEVLGESALAAPQYKVKGAAILAGDYAPNFAVTNLLKDITLGAEAAQSQGWSPPMNALARELFSLAVTQGYGGEDYAAVVKVLAAQAGVTLGAGAE